MDLINGRTAEEIKKTLKICGEGRCTTQGCPHAVHIDCSERAMRDALALIERLEAKVPRWISVDERLPEGEGSYLTYALGMEIVLDYNCYGEWWDDELNHYDGSVTHWMPLPEPPKEGAHEAE